MVLQLFFLFPYFFLLSLLWMGASSVVRLHCCISANCVFCCKTSRPGWRESQTVGGARFWCLKDLCFEFIWKQQPGCQKSFITAHIWIFLPSAVNSQLQKVVILVLCVAPPHAHHPARHAPLIPESSLFPTAWSRLVYLGLFSSFPSPAGSTWTPFRQNGACLPP